jgi:hypothetical protein
MMSDISQIDGRYHVEREIARGGIGVVYAVVDTSAGNRIALKRWGLALAIEAHALLACGRDAVVASLSEGEDAFAVDELVVSKHG